MFRNAVIFPGPHLGIMSQSAQAEIITCIPSNCQHLPNGKAIYSHHGPRSNHWANYKFTGRRFGEQHWKEGLLWRIKRERVEVCLSTCVTPLVSVPSFLFFFFLPLFSHLNPSLPFPPTNHLPSLSGPSHSCLHLSGYFTVKQ